MAQKGHHTATLRKPSSHGAVTDDAKTWLAEHGFDPIYGARPLRRLVQKEIGDQLARAILSGDVRDGQSVTVEVAGDHLVLA